MARRLAAAVALLALAAAPVVAIAFAIGHLALVVVTAVAVVAAGGFGWIAVTRHGAARVVASILTAAAVVAIAIAFFVVLPVTNALRDVALVVGVLVVAVLASRYALRRPADVSMLLPRSTRAAHPVAFMNPKSGGGKVVRFNLVEEARRRGIEAVVLGPGDDLRALVSDAIARGADALGVAGGDGSQAIVASIAIDHELPFVCIPAGTRNHLALDLGVDRDDVVRALDAFAAGPEIHVDVGMVGDRVFVNNVSFGVYGEVVQSDEYRDAKVQTAAAMLPDLLGPGGRAPELRFAGPDGAPRTTRDLVMISNNPYEMGRFGGFGTRPRLDTGTLGILSVQVGDAGEAARFTAMQLAGRVRDFPGCDVWAATTFELDADGSVPAGVDGESVRLDPPVRFGIRPGALRVWLAPDAPGATPRPSPVRLDRAALTELWRTVRSGSRAPS